MNAQHVWAAIRANFAVVAITTIIGALLGWAAYVVAPSTYRSTVTVTLIAAGPSDVRVSDPNAATEAAIAQSSEVVERAGRDLGLSADEVTELYSAVEADTPAQSWTVRVHAGGASAEQSADRANAVAKAYVAYRVETNDAANERLKKELDELAKVAAGNERMQDLIMERRIKLVSGGQVLPTLVSPASSSGAPQGPGIVGYVAGGAVLGLLAGVLLALILNRRNLPQRGPGRHADADAAVAAAADRPASEKR